VYCGNLKDLVVVFSLWIGYILLDTYFLAVVSPYFWVNYNPAVTIIGIFLGIPGLYNAIKCFSTGTKMHINYQLQFDLSNVICVFANCEYFCKDPGIIKRPSEEEMIEIRR